MPSIDWLSFFLGLAFAYFILPMLLGFVRGLGRDNA